MFILENDTYGGVDVVLIDVNGASAVIRKQDVLTSGMVGAKVRFNFDKDWNGFTKTAIFRAGIIIKDAVMSEDIAEIPHEVLANAGVPLEIGVYGTKNNGDAVIPTVWARTHNIKQGADPSGDESTDPTLPIWAQIQNRVTNLATLKEGSTTGDAELQDIRAGYNGKIYANAGEAVRIQLSDINKYSEDNRAEIQNHNKRINELEEETISLDTHTEVLEDEIAEVRKNAAESNSSLAAEIAVERARITNLAILPDGSTTGDAELQDVRVGYNGKTYSNAGEAVRSQITEVNDSSVTGLYSKTPNRNLIDFVTESGSIVADTGEERTDTSYLRSNYIPVEKGTKVAYSKLMGLTRIALFAVYDKNKNLLYRKAGNGNGVLVSGTQEITEDGYIRISCVQSRVSEAEVKVILQGIKMLVLGNSFTQDSMAYLPPILEEMFPEQDITLGVCYYGGATVQKHIDMFNKSEKYTVFNEWITSQKKWVRHSSTTAMTLSEILTRHNWDIISIQGSCKANYEGEPENDPAVKNIVYPGKKLLKILQENAPKPFAAVTFQWLGRISGAMTSAEVFAGIAERINVVMDRLGLMDYVPIGCAMQSARTNSTLQAIGEEDANPKNPTKFGEDMMCWDGKHMQAGLPALIAAYTIALKIAEWTGNKERGIYGSKFVPTEEYVKAINAAAGGDYTTSMTHGTLQGITAENIRLAQEIAVMAVKKPTTVTDFGGKEITTDPPLVDEEDTEV